MRAHLKERIRAGAEGVLLWWARTKGVSKTICGVEFIDLRPVTSLGVDRLEQELRKALELIRTAGSEFSTVLDEGLTVIVAVDRRRGRKLLLGPPGYISDFTGPEGTNHVLIALNLLRVAHRCRHFRRALRAWEAVDWVQVEQAGSELQRAFAKKTDRPADWLEYLQHVGR